MCEEFEAANEDIRVEAFIGYLWPVGVDPLVVGLVQSIAELIAKYEHE